MDEETRILMEPYKEPSPDPNSPLGKLQAACQRSEDQSSTDLTPDSISEEAEKVEEAGRSEHPTCIINIVKVKW